ncbi:hypothetical protein RUM44_008161 [Polyplax serrata]|uniref:Uncharacterized protein n=1 Tax=Polyplax serrata TaxID=468196 RepID=A0ABR1BBJ2_POLSC
MSGKKSSQVEQDVGQPLREIKQRGVLVTLQQTMNLDWYPREIYYIGLYEVVSLRRYSGSRDRQFWSSTVSIVNEKWKRKLNISPGHWTPSYTLFMGLLDELEGTS